MFSKLKNFSEDVAKSLNDLSAPDQQASQPQQSKPDPLVQLQRNSKILQAETPDSSQLVQPTDESETPTRVTSPNINLNANKSSSTSEESTESVPNTESNQSTAEGTNDRPKPLSTATPTPATNNDYNDLPAPIKSKLKKFAKYEEKYPVLLEAYKIEKRKSQLIQIFENVLKEHTPISSISDAKVLVEYLNGLTEKNKLQNNEIRKLTKENSMLSFKCAKFEGEQTFEETKKTIENLKKENKELQERIKNSENESQSFKKEAEELKKLKFEQDEKLSKLNEKLQEKKGKQNQSNEINMPSTEKLDEDTTKDAEFSSSLNTENILTQRDQEIKELVTKLKDARQKLEDKEEELEDLRDSLKSMGNDLVTAKDEIKAFKSRSNESFNEDEAEAKSKSKGKGKGKGKSKNITSNNIDNTTSTSDVVSNGENHWKDQHDKKVTEISTLKVKISSLEEEAHEHLKESKRVETLLRKEIQEHKKQATALESQLGTARNELADYKKEKNNLEARITELSNFKNNDTSLKLEIASLQSSLKHKDETIKDLNARIESLKSEKSTYTNKISSLTKSNEQLQENSIGLLKDKNELLTKQEQLINNEKSIGAQLIKMQQEKQEVRNELEKTKGQLESLLSDTSDAKNEVLLYKKQYEEVAMRSKEYNMRIDSLEDDISESRGLLQEKIREASNMRRLLVDAQEIMKQRETDHKQELTRILEEKSDIERSTNLLMRKKQKDIDDLQILLSEARESLRVQSEKIRSLQAKSSAKVEEFNNNDEIAQHSSAGLESQINTLRAALSSASDRLKDLEKSNANLKKLNEDHILKFERLSKNYKLLTQQYRLMKDHEASEKKKSEERSRSSSIISATSDAASEQNNGTNIAYLKNVLLGYFEHKEQREQLLPVLKTIFQFNKEDESKFLLAVK
ncbi:Golgin imh1 [Lodderomyces elongisporus]|uniref:Golgin imh1 n=1 Tax=Lodderomyces elongisporus TaxID=36914 RepID=UPI002925BEB8|nr:Golgin imh1 [Lodderomyces elongisporus]WLF76535.1 Golgin imh1 [Lodderomyces elongisporus]